MFSVPCAASTNQRFNSLEKDRQNISRRMFANSGMISLSPRNDMGSRAGGLQTGSVGQFSRTMNNIGQYK